MHAVFVILALVQAPSVHKVSAPAITTVTGVEDQVELAEAGKEFNVPSVIMWAVAIKESGFRKGMPRGPGYVVIDRNADGDSIGFHRVCREYGRVQILPCVLDANGKIQPVDWSWLTPHCKMRNLSIYYHNIRCGAAILQYRYTKIKNWVKVVQRYNGAGEMAARYLNTAETIIGRLTLRLIQSAHESPDSSAVYLSLIGVSPK